MYIDRNQYSSFVHIRSFNRSITGVCTRAHSRISTLTRDFFEIPHRVEREPAWNIGIVCKIEIRSIRDLLAINCLLLGRAEKRKRERERDARQERKTVARWKEAAFESWRDFRRSQEPCQRSALYVFSM